MEIRILQLIEGARKASGLTVIIDVFRAFSLEAYLFAGGVEKIYAVGSLEEAYRLKEQHPQALLVGERGGVKCEGFDYGNSPSAFIGQDLRGRTVIHTTSAGTQGIDNAINAQEIVVGSFVNAAATAAYIKSRDPQTVSLVCMGLHGVQPTAEDTLCAEYLQSLLNGEAMADIDERLLDLKNSDGRKFFDEAQQAVFPQPDFWMCIRRDIFPFVIKTARQAKASVNRAVQISQPD
jgi:2-phosphosulfolactate phosphatase